MCRRSAGGVQHNRKRKILPRANSVFFGILAQAPVASVHAPDLNEHLKSRRNRYCVNLRKSRQGGTVKALLTMLSLMLVLASLPALADDRQVRIGFVLPLSGDWAFLGNGVRDAARLAEAELQGRPIAPKLFFEDNGGQLKESATAANRLIAVDRVDAIVSIISGVGLLIAPIAEKSGVLNFGLCSNTGVANGSFSFTNYLTTAEGAKSFLDELQRRYQPRVKLGIFSLNEEGFNQIVEQVKLQSAGRPIDIQFAELYQPESRDFRSQILRAFKEEPQVLLLLGLSPGLEIFQKQLRELRHEVPLASIEAFGLAEHKEAFNGSWFVDAAAASPGFEEKFRSAYHRELTAAAAHAHDTVGLLVEAFQPQAAEGGKPSRAEAVRFLHTKKFFQGVVGALTVDEKGIIHSNPSIKEMKNGVGVPR